ncbi:Beta-1,3-galactosyl-O-glycosyl-glycoprotein beta-1,6-N-acetylglucosaminyltransferase 4 [Bulinus truncatus]|nr:Beta-1,3-galactosyl-O-glycosyl-glycoprotein beta-1,6-N-acetylglucosaminyltransferase 4 [Bulinus truncatus]
MSGLQGLRPILVLLVWLCITLYIWVSSLKVCDSLVRQEPQKNELDYFPTDRLPESEDSFFDDDFEAEVLFVKESRPWLTSSDQIQPGHHLANDTLNATEVDMEGEGITFETAVKRKWVGFPELAGSDCQSALYSTTNNSFFPQTVKRLSETDYLSDTDNCFTFRYKYGFSRHPKVSEDERKFPIAFIILFYKDLDQVLFLLRAIYRPHNVYCLNIDTKSSVEFLEAVRSVARCLPNVFVASKLESIVYAGFSRLMADINCMKDLLRHPVKWKYVINMPGQQFPLRTNLELVRILKQYNGANDIEGLTGDMLVADRYQYKHIYVKDKQTGQLQIKKVYQPNPPPPHNLEMLKGSTYGTFSRAFVEFALGDKVAKDFLEWCKLIKSPDEYFWATLHHSKNISVPGGYRDHPHSKPWLTSYSLWISNINNSCATMYIHKICILTPEDFPLLLNKTQLFANKFYITHHPAALHCLDEMIFNLTITGQTRNLTIYKNLPFARAQRRNTGKRLHH